MTDQLIEFANEHFWAVTAILSAILVLISAVADRRRHKRKHIEHVGFMPWTGITIFGVMSTILSIALAIKSQ